MPTGVAKYPYPQPTAVPDVPADLLLLTQRLALMNGAGIGYVADAAALAATITNSDAFTGWSVYHAAADCVVRYNGAAFKISGTKRFASAAAQTSWTSTYSGLLEADALSITTDTGITYRYNGSTWKAWSSDWITYTATLANITLGSGSATSYQYKYENGLVHVRYKIVLGTSGMAVVTNPTMTLPVTAVTPNHANAAYCGTSFLYDNNVTTTYNAAIRADASSTTIVVFMSKSATVAAITATAPFTWAASDVFEGDFFYEAA